MRLQTHQALKDQPEFFGRSVVQLQRRHDSPLLQAQRHAAGDAWQVGEREMAQDVVDGVGRDDRQPVGLLQVGGQLGQESIGSHTN